MCWRARHLLGYTNGIVDYGMYVNEEQASVCMAFEVRVSVRMSFYAQA